jgi:peptidyl-prolyl cis-trans isomerase A (cyclophilin A)
MSAMTLHTAVADIATNRGHIHVNLFGHHAPHTVDNFVGLSNGTKEWSHPETGANSSEPLYNGVVFHRIIPDFMIQGGDPLGTGTGGPGYRFDDEIHGELVFDRPYLLAMANAGPGTNGSQFFITIAATPWLNGKHTIFGEVADDASRAIVDEIGVTPTDGRDRPLDAVVIESITITPVA